MGWSCAAAAGKVMDAWTNACIAQTGSQNTFKAGGKTYFWETSRTEHADGAITGKVMVMISETHCKPSGTFRINGDGTIARAPRFLVNAAKS